MNILFVSQYFYPETFKGNDLVFDFVEKGHNVTVLTGKPNYPKGKFYNGYSFWGQKIEIINGAKVIRCPTFPRKNGNGLFLFLNYFSFVFFSYFKTLFSFKEKYDIIFVQQLSPITVALPAIWIKNKKHNIDTPIYLWVLDLWPESIYAVTKFNKNILTKLIDKLVRYIYINSTYILISSKMFEKNIREKILDVEKEIIYLPNWAENIFENNEINPINIDHFPVGFNIMFTGNIVAAQDLETVLKAAELSRFDNINWIIVGDGRMLTWLKNEISNKKLNNIFLLGSFDIKYMPYLYNKADVMLISLKNDKLLNYTVPAKFQSYTSAGKIILGAINGDTCNFINEECLGISGSAGDYNLLYKNANYLKNLSLEMKKKMESNSRNFYINNFQKQNTLNRLEKHFLINSK